MIAQTTWSGQPAENALHWCKETYQRLGHVVELLYTGKAEHRNQAYEEFIELKRWFIPFEFDEYIESLDNFRVQKNAKPLSTSINEIHEERSPKTDWKAVDGDKVSPVVPPEISIHLPSNEKVQASQLAVNEIAGFKDRLKINIQSEQLSLF